MVSFPDLNPLSRMLIPVIRFLFRRGWNIQQIEEVTKIALLQSAEEELKKKNATVNVSRLSIATGLHRREVMRLWRDEEPKASTASLVTKVIGAWPKKKKYLSYEGKESEFSKLVETITTDINSYTILFELERAGLVEKTDKGLGLVTDIYQPDAKDVERSHELLMRDTSDLIHAVEANIYGKAPIRNLHSNTEFDNIPVEHIPELKKQLLKMGSEFQKKVNALLSQYDRDNNKKVTGTGRARVSVGVFSLTEEKDDHD